MFWLATAPTPDRAYAHRAATAGEEEEIAIPNMPVSAQRATREKVMCLVRYNRSCVYFYQPFWSR